MAFKCDQCSYSALKNSMIRNHKLSVHSDLRPWACPQPGCDYRGKLQTRLKQHARTHDSNAETRKPFQCTAENCEYRAAEKATLKDHIQAAHMPGKTRDFQCPLCPAGFYTKKRLKIHIPCHTKERKFKCEKCDFSTHYKTCLEGHVRARHETSAKYKCSFEGCNFEAHQRGILLRHIRQCHDSDPSDRQIFQCNFPSCSYSTCFSSDLIKHKNVRHNPNRTRHVKCPMCPKSFFDKGGLRSHINHIHTNQWSYKCGECDYVSKSSSNFFKHRRETHMQIPQATFKCQSCDYESKRKYHVSRHLRTVHRSDKDQLTCKSSTFDLHPLQPPEFENPMQENHEETAGRRIEMALYSSLSHRIPVVLLVKIGLKIV